MWFPAFFLTPALWSVLPILSFRTSRNSKICEPPPLAESLRETKYSEEETNALKLFRPMVSDVLQRDYEQSDQFLIRWIRASSHDLNAANEMLRRAQNWKRDNNIDGILEEKPSDSKVELCNINGIAYDNSQVFSIKSTGMDTRKQILTGHLYNLTRQVDQCIEKVAHRLWNLTLTTGKDVSQAIAIVDASGYNIRQHACAKCFSFYLQVLRDGQNFYPEYLKYVVIINAPMILKPLVDISTPLMHSSTKSAVRIFGSDKKEWSSFLLERIPPDQLSKKYGGTANW